MAEKPRKLTQADIDRILFSQQVNMDPQSLQMLQPGATGSAAPIPQNVFQKIAGGAGIAREAVNRLGNAADLAKLFPGYTGQSQVTIPTGFSFAPKQTPTGEVTPGGLQTQQVNVNELLKAIKPADVLGISGAERAYSDIGAGRAPQPMDVVDTLALGAGGVAGVKGAAKTGIAAGKYAAPEVGRMAEQYAIKSGLISPLDAYHGSPYTFDAFDLSKVGTGEGSQAYGYGMYFAESPDVAKTYVPMKMAEFEGKKVASANLQTGQVLFDDGSKTTLGIERTKQLADAMKNAEMSGSFYKVDIPDDAVKTFIDWDKKISSQGLAKDALSKINKKYGFDYDETFTGGDLYNALTTDFIRTGLAKDGKQAQKMASDELNAIGVKGIKYFDQKSRGEGKGTRNFVVFDPSIVKMLERNDKPVK